MKTLIKITALILITTPCMAQEMTLVSYEEVEDCKQPSERIPVVNEETGQVGYVVKSPCEKDRK